MVNINSFCQLHFLCGATKGIGYVQYIESAAVNFVKKMTVTNQLTQTGY